MNKSIQSYVMKFSWLYLIFFSLLIAGNYLLGMNNNLWAMSTLILVTLIILIFKNFISDYARIPNFKEEIGLVFGLFLSWAVISVFVAVIGFQSYIFRSTQLYENYPFEVYISIFKMMVISFTLIYFFSTLFFRLQAKKIIKFNTIAYLFGPLMILPQTILGTIFFLSIYSRPMETGIFDNLLFLQGSIDMGCELVFVATLGLYLIFGFTASWYLVYKLEELKTKRSFLARWAQAVYILKYHLIIFFLWNIDSNCDTRIVPNDFRNMFLFVILLYFLTIVLVVTMDKFDFSKKIKLIFAPTFIVLWLYIGSDGNTARANQIPIWKDNPHYVVTSKKHAVMIAWHNLCDDFFGDPKPHYTYQYER